MCYSAKQQRHGYEFIVGTWSQLVLASRSAEPYICGRTKVDIIISDVKLYGWCPNTFANKMHIMYR